MFEKDVALIGVDLGATNVRSALIVNGQIVKSFQARLDHKQVLNQLEKAIEEVQEKGTDAIGIGVPGLVDLEKGIVFDVVNIPSWKEVPLKEIMENKFNVPVLVNNDANCFALGEKYFGIGKNYRDLLGVTMGTGLGVGVVINNRLYNGANCGAGEFGMLPYLGKNLEYYCSGQFFKKHYGLEGETVFARAKEGDEQAAQILNEFGFHLGKALQIMFYTYDPQLIVLGGSISQAFPLFEKSMYQSFFDTPFQKSAKKLRIAVSSLPQAAVLGAALLPAFAEEPAVLTGWE